MKTGYLSAEQLLFLSAWRPIETDTTATEGAVWTCLNCAEKVSYFRSLARLEGSAGQFMIQCPACDHLHVLSLDPVRPGRLDVAYGGPHIDRFLSFLDRRNEERDREDGFEEPDREGGPDREGRRPD